MNKPIRVLYISNIGTMLGGASKSIFDILSNLDRSCVSPFFASIYDETLATNIKNLGVPFFKLPIISKKDPKSIFLSTMRIIKFIKQNKIDIIHNNQSHDTIYSILPAKITRTAIITHHRDLTFYKLNKFLAVHVTTNIAISSWQNKVNLNNKGVLIHNGIPRDHIPNEIPKRSWRQKKVGLVGRIAPMKGQDIFIKAAGLVHKTMPGVSFHIIGDDSRRFYPDYMDYLNKLVNDLNLNDTIKFHGYIDNLPAIYTGLEISVVPSRREPFGKTIIESMAFGLPVIGTEAGGATDIITRETGLIVPPEDEQTLAEAMLKLLINPELCSQMGENGRKRVLENFTIDHTLSKLYALYENLPR